MHTQDLQHQARNPVPGGFTLLELLVALALMVIISGALYSTYFALVRGRETATAGMEARRELRTTLDMVRRELAAAFYRTENRKDNRKYFHFVVEDRDFFGKPASTLNFTTVSPPSSGNLPVSDQMEVRYRPVDQDGKIVLTRQVRDVYLATEPLPYPQMEELEGFLVECYDGSKWVRSWDTDSALNRALPKNVRVTITIREGDKIVAFTATAAPRGERQLTGEKGFALVLTLIVTALLVALTVEFVNDVYVDTSARQNFIDGQQASLMADSGMTAGMKLLGLALGKQDYTSLADLDRFAALMKVEDESGLLQMTAEEESGKLNINAIVNPNGTVNQTYYDIGARLFKKLGLRPDLLDAVADWIDSNDEPRPGGAETSYYQALKPPCAAKNGVLETFDELRLIKGFDARAMELLRPYLTVYPDVTRNFSTVPININTAPKELIAVLDDTMTDDLAQRIIDYRKTTPLKTPTDLANSVPGMERLALELANNYRIKQQEKGAVYRLVSRVRVRETVRAIEAMVRVYGFTPTILYWREY